MTRRVILSIACAVWCFASVFMGAAHAQGVFEDAPVATTTWPPYVGGDGPGVATTVVTETLRGMGREPSVVSVANFGVALDAGDQVFGIYPFLMSQTRAQTYYFTDPIMDFEYVIVVRADEKSAFDGVQALAGLAAFKTRRTAGYAYGALDEHVSDEADPLPSQVVALQMLLDDDPGMDYVAISRLHYRWLLDHEFFNDRHNFAVLDAPDQDALRWAIDLHVLIHKQRPNAGADLIAFNQALAQVRATRLPERLKRQVSDDTRDRDFVVLTDPASFSLVTARLPQGPGASCAGVGADDPSVTVPRGARAVVLAWSENFQRPHRLNVHEQLQALSAVRILNGPLKDEVVCVQSMFIELSDPEPAR